MVRYFENSIKGTFFRIELDDDIIFVRTGRIGDEGDEEIIDDPFEQFGMPADIVFEEMQPPDDDFEPVMVDNLIDYVQRGHDVELTGRLREFYTNHEYKRYQGWLCREFDCVVDFDSPEVQGNFFQDYYDSAKRADRKLIPISSKWTGEDFGYKDEQQWIGVDPSLPDGPVFALYTSGEFDEAYPNLDAFLADLSPRD